MQLGVIRHANTQLIFYDYSRLKDRAGLKKARGGGVSADQWFEWSMHSRNCARFMIQNPKRGAQVCLQAWSTHCLHLHTAPFNKIMNSIKTTNVEFWVSYNKKFTRYGVWSWQVNLMQRMLNVQDKQHPQLSSQQQHVIVTPLSARLFFPPWTVHTMDRAWNS